LKIYTNKGDRGKTGLFSGERTSKADSRVEAYGEVDELNSVLGALVSALSPESEALPSIQEAVGELEKIQSELFCVGAWLATRPDSGAFQELPDLDSHAVERLEASIDRMEETLSPISGFILPGGHPTASQAHVARTVCRRAERRVAALLDEVRDHPSNERVGLALKYLNRLSDYLFTLARSCNHLHGVQDVNREP